MSDEMMQRLFARARALRYRGLLEQPTAEGTYTNRSCGDRLRFMVVVVDDVVTEVAFEASGCVLSQVAADVAAEMVDQRLIVACGEISDEKIIEALGVQLGPNRRECVTVAVAALRQVVRGSVASRGG